MMQGTQLTRKNRVQLQVARGDCALHRAADDGEDIRVGKKDCRKSELLRHCRIS